MAHLKPELFHAYVGVSQLVGPQDLTASYALALQRARELGDPSTMAKLQAPGSPPWVNPRSFGKLRRILRGYEAQRTDAGLAWKPATEYAGPQDQAAYEAGEDFLFLKFVGGDGMLWRLDLTSRLPVARRGRPVDAAGCDTVLLRPHRGSAQAARDRALRRPCPERAAAGGSAHAAAG